MPIRPRRLGSYYDFFLKKEPQQARSRSIVEAILVAAREAISRDSSDEGSSIRHIAARAGVGIASLYDYFGDRRSLLASVAARATEDNLADFERFMASVSDLPLRSFIDAIAGYTLDIYTVDVRLPRSIVQIACRAGLMPMLAESQKLFAMSLAASLKRRTDVNVPDLNLAAYVVTQASMGVVHTLVWESSSDLSRELIRRETVDMIFGYLSGGNRASRQGQG